MKKKQEKYGREAFLRHYKSYFPDESFIKKLEVETKPILRFHPKNEDKLRRIWQEKGVKWEISEIYPYALEWPTEEIEEENLFYVMNAASLIPVLNLDIQPGQKVLDACAAPGGKALFISELIKGKGELIVNDSSPARLQRLLRTFENFGEKKPTHHNTNAAILFKRYQEHFDRILLDAPCSSEKHVWKSEKHLNEWSYGRIRQLKQRQLSLINGLFLALKPGGRMVYSTCAINPEENEQVIEKFLKKYQNANLVKMENIQGPNLDPMFIAVIEKKFY